MKSHRRKYELYITLSTFSWDLPQGSKVLAEIAAVSEDLPARGIFILEIACSNSSLWGEF